MRRMRTAAEMLCPLGHGLMQPIGPDPRDEARVERYECTLCALELEACWHMGTFNAYLGAYLVRLVAAALEAFSVHRQRASLAFADGVLCTAVGVTEALTGVCPAHPDATLVTKRAGSARHEAEVDWLVCPICGFEHVKGDQVDFYWRPFVRRMTDGYAELLVLRQRLVNIVQWQVEGKPGLCPICFAIIHPGDSCCSSCGTFMYVEDLDSEDGKLFYTTRLVEVLQEAGGALDAPKVQDKARAVLVKRANMGMCPAHLPLKSGIEWGLRTFINNADGVVLDGLWCVHSNCEFLCRVPPLTPVAWEHIEALIVSMIG